MLPIDRHNRYINFMGPMLHRKKVAIVYFNNKNRHTSRI